MSNRKTVGFPKLINIESNCDGSGKQTVATLLEKSLVEQGYSVMHTDFPRYGEYSGSLIERHLKHDALAISNKHFNDAFDDGFVVFKDGTKKSADYFLTKEEAENISSIKVINENGNVVETGACMEVTVKGLIKILPFAFDKSLPTAYELGLFRKALNDWLDKELKEVLFKPGSKPSHITRSMCYVVDRDIWYNNELPKLDETCPYDVIISDRSYMSNIIYRTLDLTDEELFDYLLFTKVGELKAQQIEKLPIENVYNVLLHHKSFDFNKEVILKRAAGKELDATERDWDYQKKLFTYALSINSRIEDVKSMLYYAQCPLLKVEKYQNYASARNAVFNIDWLKYFKLHPIEVSGDNGWYDTKVVVNEILTNFNLK